MADDNRPAQTVIRQYERIEQIKTKLIKQGTLNGDATPQQVVAALRSAIPPDLFGAK